ncbi:MAG: radical SAM protein [Lactobacillales bacterium]|nr:radical SAM protein [Lactobacillales bacterium]
MEKKYIHLLYVPTMACNMGCKYCYLEDNTKDEKTCHNALDTLKYAIDKFKSSDVIPFNISLHGGEVTTLSKNDFHDIVKFISDYYNDNKKIITEAGFRLGTPHIKTNLYDLNKHIDTIKEFNVSISGSLDLPLFLHDEYRVTKGNKKTLDRILENIKLLEEIPNKKKVSSTIFKEHYIHLDEIIKDIKYLHQNTCLDMNDFNFMIGFDYNSNGILHHITEEEQVNLYKRMHQEFDGTDLDRGVNGPWFDEFGPDYCPNCDNCGEKFFLLEKNGDIYSCVRGQKNPEYYYGNIYKNTVEEILNTAKNKIFLNHNKQELSEECTKCGYLYLCKTGCPFVKNTYNSSKSYTCKLQQEMYKDRNLLKDEFNEEFVYEYVKKMRLEDKEKYLPNKKQNDYLTLEELIDQDQNLKYIYDNNSFILKIDDKEYVLSSQIIKKTRDIIYITPNSKIEIWMRKHLIEEMCDYPENNSLYIMLLTGNLVTYGDENRTKQRHVATHQIYKGVLDNCECDDEFYIYDISNMIKQYKNEYSLDKPNNIFFTTSSLRDYHYIKQKNNAYYHIQAINLPFQNIEFYYLDKELKK